MDILLGFLLCLFFEGMAWFGWRIWRRNLAPPPRPAQPQTAAQQANKAAYEAYEADHPQAVRLRVRRRRRRGKVEREYDPFE